ncbi:trypsin inhibitor like cysteine rich domain-containing protein [Ditylenchus destructor]|nr:trypsin inhibitor like cysteine rich domain-containing protein [Ditylenchus destructor]
MRTISIIGIILLLFTNSLAQQETSSPEPSSEISTQEAATSTGAPSTTTEATTSSQSPSGTNEVTTSSQPSSTTTPQCDTNEQFRECGSSCEPTCENPNPQFCTADCILNVCQCAPGFVRNDDDECVTLSQCNNSTNTTCGLNERFYNCSTCDRTCENPNPICTRECRPPRCQCAPGFVENRQGRCIPQAQCPRSLPIPINPCSYRMCPFGTYCRAVTYPCFAPPCPQRGICVNVCDNYRCPRFHRCVPRNLCPFPACPVVPACVRYPIFQERPFDSFPWDK